MINPDYFGYYQVGDFKSYSKLEAIEIHKKTNIHPHWNFNELTFSCYDWKVEPQESLKELYKRRAEQIRNRYDYIVLPYSGGADSDNVLHSFIDNGFHIDEILSFSNYDATGEKINHFNAEIFEVAIPKIQKLQQQFPLMKHRVIDLGQATVNTFSLTSKSIDWIYSMNGMFGPNNTARKDLKTNNKDYQKIIDSGKKIGFVWGKDKPRINQINGKYIFRFLDIIDDAVTSQTQILNREWDNDELFYWTPEIPEIVIKQAHVVKNYLKTASIDSPYITTTSKINSYSYSPLSSSVNISGSYKEINEKKYWLTMNGLHFLIYPTWKPTPYQFKSSSAFFSARDEWFFKLPDSDTAKKSWKIGLDYLWKTIPDYWKNDPTDMARGIKNCWSKDYYLE